MISKLQKARIVFKDSITALDPVNTASLLVSWTRLSCAGLKFRTEELLLFFADRLAYHNQRCPLGCNHPT